MARPTRSTSKSVQPAKTTPKSTKSTPKRSPRNKNSEKSKYFEAASDDEESSYEEPEEEPSSASEDENYESEDEPPKKKAKSTPTKKISPKKAAPKKAASRRQSKKEESHEEPWETFIPKEASPDAGDVEYEDSKIHPSTLLFLKDLAENNDREWFWSHEKRYRAAEKDFKTFIEAMAEKLMEVDPTIPPLPLKDVIFRIYRDIRFSNDKTLYKDHFSAAWSRTGRKGPYAAYYFHLQPGNQSFIAGGKWRPDAGHLARIRHCIHNRPNKFKRPLLKPAFKKAFGGIDGLLTTEDRLSTAPKGYAKDHKDIELLKLKSYRIVSRVFTDDEVIHDDFLDKCGDTFRNMVEFITMLNDVCMPDDDVSSEDDEEGEEVED